MSGSGAGPPLFTKTLTTCNVHRIEFTSDKLDAVIDDFSIPTLNIIPDAVSIRTMHDYTWRKHAPSSDITSDVRLTLSALRVAVKDISFYTEERFTAPLPTTCWGCCGCGESRSCAGGPANWLAYEEKALLDAGFGRDGVDVTIDFKTWTTDSNEEELERTRFFKVQEAGLDAGNALILNLRRSRHWILNKVLLSVARPTLRVLIERVSKGLLQHGFEKADEKVFDIYARARYLVWTRCRRQGELVDAAPGIFDYLRVAFSHTAGKTPARIAAEKEKAEEEARVQREEEEEEQAYIARQPEPVKPLQIKPTVSDAAADASRSSN